MMRFTFPVLSASLSSDTKGFAILILKIFAVFGLVFLGALLISGIYEVFLSFSLVIGYFGLASGILLRAFGIYSGRGGPTTSGSIILVVGLVSWVVGIVHDPYS